MTSPQLQAYIKRGASYVADGGRSLGAYDPLTFSYGIPGVDYFPSATTTGIPAGSPPLQTVITGTNGIYTITTPNAHFDLVDFQCEVDPRALGCVITRSRISGNLIRNSPGSLLNINNNALYGTGIICSIYDSEIAPTLPSVYWNGISNHDFKARRVKVTGCVDSFNAWGGLNAGVNKPANVDIEGCWAGLHSMFSPDPNHASDSPIPKTHNDVIQWQGGSGLRIVGNTLEGYCDMTIGEVNYPSTSPHTPGGGPNLPVAWQGLPGYNETPHYTHRPNINSSILQISGANGGLCSGLDMRLNLCKGANRVITNGQTLPGMGACTDNTVWDEQTSGWAMNIASANLSGTNPNLTLARNYYLNGDPIRVLPV